MLVDILYKDVVHMAGKKSIKHKVIPVPKDKDESAEVLAKIAKEQRKIERIKSELNEEVDKLKADATSQAKEHEENILELVEGLYVFAEANRDSLTYHGRRKTVELSTGIFGWRLTPPAVKISNIKKVLASLDIQGLKRFIRIKREINREAMLQEPDLAKTIKGVTISQVEEFIVKPKEEEIETSFDIKKLKKAIS